jgi:hypothetical protein
LRAEADLPGYHKRTQLSLSPIIVWRDIAILGPMVKSLSFLTKDILDLLNSRVSGLMISNIDDCIFDFCRLPFELSVCYI